MPVSAHLVPGTGCQDYIISFGVRRRECFISVGTGDLAEDEKCIDTMYKCVKIFVLEQLSGLLEISHRAMMGEYVLYYRGRVIGGIYDDRLLLKLTKAAEEMIPDAEKETPYEGAKEMLLVDVDDRETMTRLIEAMYPELPEPKKRKK